MKPKLLRRSDGGGGGRTGIEPPTVGLRGRGVVAIWNDIEPRARSRFEEWHSREHIPERLRIPGFNRGRRLVALKGAPEYFTLYEADTPEVLVSEAYIKRLDNPTPQTAQVLKWFRNSSRAVCWVAHSSGVAQGGIMLTLRFDALPGRHDDLLHYLMVTALPPLVRNKQILGVHLCVSDQAASAIQTAERKGRAIEVPNWLVLIEASQPGGADCACNELIEETDFQDLVACHSLDRGLYALEISREREP